MSIESQRDIDGLRRAGRVVAVVLRALERCVRAGTTTGELDRLGGELLACHGARSAPAVSCNFPGSLCISVNDEAVHGVPGARRIRAGDLVKLDLVAELDGYFADAAVSVVVPPALPIARRLVKTARRAFARALGVIQAGRRVADVGAAIEREVRRAGFAIIPALAGHGVGRAIHEPPCVPNFADRSDPTVLTDGLVLAVEPIITAGGGQVAEAGDGWTVKTTDGALAAHYEHTLIVTRTQPIIVTAV